MKTYQHTGGARVGITNATFPFAKLKVDKNQLELNVSMVGKYIFASDDVVSIKTYTLIPLLGQGIKINHSIDTYPDKIIFWTFRSPKLILQNIETTGFLQNKGMSNVPIDENIRKLQAQGGNPLKKQFLVGAFIIWNLLFGFDLHKLFSDQSEGQILGVGAISALSLVILIGLLSIFSTSFRELILKKGRKLEEIKTTIYFLLFICTIMLIGITSFYKTI